MTDSAKQPVKPEVAPLQPTAAPPEALKPVSPEVQAIVGGSQQQRMELAGKELSGKLPLPGASVEKKNEPYENPAVPEAKPASAPGATPAPAPGTPPEKAGQPSAAEPQKEGEPAKPATDAEKRNKDFIKFLEESKAEAKSAPLGELFGRLLQSVSNLSGLLTGFMDKLSGSMKKAADKMMPADKFTDDDLKKIKVDLSRAVENPDPKTDKSTEYVTTVLKLPPKDTPQKLLDALTRPEMPLKKMDEIKNLKKGDVLFFKRKNDKDVYLCAVVSKNDPPHPLQMKLVPEGGGPPTEMTAETSKYFKDGEFYGFVKLPQKEGETPAQPAEAPAEKPPGTTDKPAAPESSAPATPVQSTPS